MDANSSEEMELPFADYVFRLAQIELFQGTHTLTGVGSVHYLRIFA